MKEKKTPLAAAVNGQAEAVAQKAEAYQAHWKQLEHAETLQGIQRGLDEFEQGQGRPALEKLREKYGIPH